MGTGDDVGRRTGRTARRPWAITPEGGGDGAAAPLVLWYGSQDVSAQPDLYKAQLRKLGRTVNERLEGGGEVESPEGVGGMIVIGRRFRRMRTTMPTRSSGSGGTV